MRPTLETTQSILKIITALANAEIRISGVESKALGFYVIWWYGASIREENDIRKALRTIEGLDFCEDETGFLSSKGAFLTVSL